MPTIHTLTLGDYQTNCYIVHDAAAKSCAIIDPGYEAETILKTVARLGLTVDAILLTHGHFDHVGAVEEIVEKTGCRLWMGKADWANPIDPMTTSFFPLSNCDFTEVLFCEEQTEISAGGLTFLCLKTPGHTWGSVCYVCGDVMFSGDTLFAGTCGRIDLPGGDENTMMRSLARLAEMEQDYTLFPGHGSATTLSREKRSNPYLPAAQGNG